MAVDAIDRGSVRVAALCDDEHGFTASFMDSWNPFVAFDLGQQGRIWRGGYEWQRVSSVGIEEGRNEAVRVFLDSPAEWLFFVDSDMGFEHDGLERLIAVADPEERPIVGGLCFGYGAISERIDHAHAVVKRPFPVIFNLERSDGDLGFRPQWSYRPGSLVPCDATGAAFLLIHRSVLERIREEWGDVWFERIKHPDAEKKWGEDTSFCYRVKQLLGIPVHVHTGVRTSHAKTIYVTETTYMSEIMAKPATDEIAVIVPVLDRPQNAVPFMRSLRASTGLASVLAVCSTESDAEAWEAAGASVLRTDRISFAEKVNEGYSKTSEPWVFLVGDDVTFRPGWLDHAQAVARNTGAKVIGTNDWANERVMRGEHATHMLIARDYIDEHGASWDGPGVVCHEGYRHWYVDDEIVTVAKQRGVFGPALASVVEHHHPLFGTAPDDETYRRGQRHAGKDKATFVKRAQQFVQAA